MLSNGRCDNLVNILSYEKFAIRVNSVVRFGMNISIN
ncbi:protein of unknown function [Burkholderia multivorans]